MTDKCSSKDLIDLNEVKRTTRTLSEYDQANNALLLCAGFASPRNGPCDAKQVANKLDSGDVPAATMAISECKRVLSTQPYHQMDDDDKANFKSFLEQVQQSKSKEPNATQGARLSLEFTWDGDLTGYKIER